MSILVVTPRGDRSASRAEPLYCALRYTENVRRRAMYCTTVNKKAKYGVNKYTYSYTYILSVTPMPTPIGVSRTTITCLQLARRAWAGGRCPWSVVQYRITRL